MFSKTNSTIEFYRENGHHLNSLNIIVRPNFRFGIGYNFNDKFSFELRFQTPDELLNNAKAMSTDYLNLSHSYIYTEYRNVSVIIGYNIF